MSDPLGPSTSPPPQRSRRDRARMLVGAVALVAATVFVLSNTQKVRIDWVVTTTETPLIVALAIALLLGALLGSLAVRQRRRRRAADAGE